MCESKTKAHNVAEAACNAIHSYTMCSSPATDNPAPLNTYPLCPVNMLSPKNTYTIGYDQGTSQNYSAIRQNNSNYRRTAECPQNRQTFVIFARLKFYLFLSAARTHCESYSLKGGVMKICET